MHPQAASLPWSSTSPSCFVLQRTDARDAFAVCDKPRLFAFGYAGGSVNALHGLLGDFSSYFDVIGVELPGRGLRLSAALERDLPGLVDQLATDVKPLCSRKSLFFGYSFGALVAADIAHRLHMNGNCQVMGLISLSAKAPALVVGDRTRSDLDSHELLELLRQLGGIPDEILRSEELVGQALSAVRADLECYEQFKTEKGRCLPCAVLAFWGSQDPFIKRSDVEAWMYEPAARFRPTSRLAQIGGKHFCHLGNEAAIQDAVITWARQLGVLSDTEELSTAPPPPPRRRFVWSPVNTGAVE